MNTRVVNLLSIVVLAVVAGCASMTAPSVTPTIQAEPADLETQLAAYVEVQEALAADDFEAAKTQLEGFARVADDATRALALRALEAGDIAAMRAGFKPLSESLAELELPQGFARAYCPMYDNGAPWVQRDGPVRNPYYGAVMLTCGVVDAAAGAHMDHTPRHGGTVFMAPDSFHHLEGTYPEPGVFRVYASNNYREPVDVSTWSGRAVTEEEYDETTDEFIEVAAFDLIPSPGGEYLEARIPVGGLPAEVTAKVIFQADFPAERFDFIFCCGILHRVEAPARLLRLLSRRLAGGGRVLIETHGVFEDPSDGHPVHRYAPGEVYPQDDYVYWGFTAGGIEVLGRESGFRQFELVDAPVIDGHPRIIGWLRR